MKLLDCFGSFSKIKSECQNCEFAESCKKFVKKEEVIKDLESILEIIKEMKIK
jgi:hypothetical protein